MLFADNSASRGRSADGKRMKRFEKFRYEKSLANVPRTLDLRSEQLYLLIEVDELKYLLEVRCETIKQETLYFAMLRFVVFDL